MRSLPVILILLSLLISSCRTDKKTSSKATDDNIAREYYTDGTIKSETESKDGKANGLAKNYNKDGGLESVYTFKDGIQNGPAVTYYPTGELKLKMYYSDGKREGNTLWYYRSGKLFRETPYKNGKIEGIMKSYYEDGKVMAEAPYLNNHPGTGLREYNQKGELIKDETRIIVNDLYGASSKEKVYFELSLNRQQPGTTFYLGELTDGKYLNESLVPIPEYDKGKARYTLFRNQSSVQGHLLTFSASYQTSNSNYRIVTKTIKLAPAGY